MLSFLVAFIILFFANSESVDSNLQPSNITEQEIPNVEVPHASQPTILPSAKPTTSKVVAYNESSDRIIGSVAAVAVERAVPLIPTPTSIPTPVPSPTATSTIIPILPSPEPTFQIPPGPCEPYQPESINPPIQIPPFPCPQLTI